MLVSVNSISSSAANTFVSEAGNISIPVRHVKSHITHLKKKKGLCVPQWTTPANCRFRNPCRLQVIPNAECYCYDERERWQVNKSAGTGWCINLRSIYCERSNRWQHIIRSNSIDFHSIPTGSRQNGSGYHLAAQVVPAAAPVLISEHLVITEHGSQRHVLRCRSVKTCGLQLSQSPFCIGIATFL